MATRRSSRTASSSGARPSSRARSAPPAEAALPWLRPLDVEGFLAAAAPLRALAGRALYVVDTGRSDATTLHLTRHPGGGEPIVLPAAALAAVTPIALDAGDPTRVVVALDFRPDFASLDDTFARLTRADVGAPTRGAAAQIAVAAVADPDEDPGAPAAGDLAADGADAELVRAVINFGVEQGDAAAPPAGPGARRGRRSPGAAPAVAAAPPVMPLDVAKLTAFFTACATSVPRVGYGAKPGQKLPRHGALPGKEFRAVDCSGFVWEAIWRATMPRVAFPDGSWVQHEWVKARRYRRVTPADALRRDGVVRIAFLRKEDSPSGIGHVALVHDAATLESHGGVGPNRRPWTATKWQAKAFVYELTRARG